jgi:hypothetical protein
MNEILEETERLEGQTSFETEGKVNDVWSIFRLRKRFVNALITTSVNGLDLFRLGSSNHITEELQHERKEK